MKGAFNERLGASDSKDSIISEDLNQNLKAA
jgi:hypothetical protein